MTQLSYIKKTGAEIASVFDELAQLRITVFRAFPYLYEGSIAYEKEYLKVYCSSANAFLFAVYDGTQMVGATTCIPLLDETTEVQEPFINAGIDLSSVFYFGESILLPQYRGLGLGHRFFDEREAHARNFKTCKMTCFCSVVRPENHQLKPVAYQPLDAFWTKRGYQKEPSLKSKFEWLDIGEELSTQKEMIYWTKQINPK
ncbi:GNAT family acetyltransferase [Emticicia aquatilis]|uniref:GNAT family acetyltransferase n=1 Tax=Emticicia aquatilis TaxID=1537369 RepID=A0A916YDV4_9BACT|nr:GNAT family N-acetyltransferase [Emticicia aquatilis]GGD41304.1 GNAT family acetyltransferase [Emticicia aquatilis]